MLGGGAFDFKSKELFRILLFCLIIIPKVGAMDFTLEDPFIHFQDVLPWNSEKNWQTNSFRLLNSEKMQFLDDKWSADLSIAANVDVAWAKAVR